MVVSMIEVNYNRRQDCWNNVHRGGYTVLFISIFWNSDDYFECFLLPQWVALLLREKASEIQANMKWDARILWPPFRDRTSEFFFIRSFATSQSRFIWQRFYERTKEETSEKKAVDSSDINRYSKLSKLSNCVMNCVLYWQWNDSPLTSLNRVLLLKIPS